MIQYGLFLRWC
ncbi:hypothetical protein YPPY09_1901, partial [Yersinia pestis PY-09]